MNPEIQETQRPLPPALARNNTPLVDPQSRADSTRATRTAGRSNFANPACRARAVESRKEPEARNGHSTPLAGPSSSPRRRQCVYRCVRVVLAVVLVFAAIRHTRAVFMTAMSDQAYVNAQITALRAPIGGQLLLEPFASGRVLSAGLPLFRIANQRFGNEAAMSHWNWVKELAERLRAESDEAAIRFQQQNEVYRLHEKLFTEGLISRLAFLEEQTRLALAGSAWTNKQAQAAQADARSREIEAQVELQKEAVVAMPFDGTVWSVPARSGAQVSVHEPILEVIDPKQIRVDAFFHERHAGQFGVGTPVTVRTLDGHAVWPGTVESVRSGVGRIAYDGVSAVSPGDYARRRIAVRVRLDAASPFDAGQFFGVGRSVVVTLRSHE